MPRPRSVVHEQRKDCMKSHYVIHPHWTSVYVFLFCLLLACGIGFLGYSQTKHALERWMSNVEPDGAANGSQPVPSE